MKNIEIKEPKKLAITVNGRKLETFPGITILQALMAENIHVPHLCYDPRLLEPNRSCGLCVVKLEDSDAVVRSCSTQVREGMVIVTNNPELESYRRIRLQELLADHNADCVAPCQLTCPAGIDIQAYLRQVANGNFAAALRIIKEKNPFPLSCGRVCPHPCETACRRNVVDEAVGINHVKRFVADWDARQETPFVPQRAKATGKRVAIVGAGPSGLSAAYYAAIAGHDVTVFERQPKAGGMLRYGIPDYRLPQEVLEKEISVIEALGVKILTGKGLGSHVRLEDLQQDFDSVYLAVGSWQASAMRVDGEQCLGIWKGIEYLEMVARGKYPDLGEHVVVVGGGNTAIDCARTALRDGARVTLVYRRTREQMPAEPYEVEAALEEGVEMLFLAAPTAFESDHRGRVSSMRCTRMELGEPDRSGRRRPIAVPGSEFELEVNSVIGAIGQKTNTSYLWNDLPVNLNRWGDIEINGKTMQTSVDGVFAGGDCVTGPATVVQAVAAGHQAAIAMDGFMTRGYVHENSEDYSCNRGSLEDLPRYEFEKLPRLPRQIMPELPPETRKKGFAEVETGLTEAEAMAEARRCLSCGCNERYDCRLRNEAGKHAVCHNPDLLGKHDRPIMQDHPFIVRNTNKCISCGRCVAACNEVAGPGVLGFYLREGKLCVGTKSGMPLDQTACVSCGQCVTSCPCGALDYRRESDRVFRAINDKNTLTIGYVAPAVRSMICSKYNVSPENAAGFMAGLLKKLGFDRVFDFVFAADLTVVEETHEFIKRLEGGCLPQFTSCCPGWVNFVEKRYPELIPHLSSCKSPQQMMGATVKNHFPEWTGSEVKPDKLFVVSVVPCLAKKDEAARAEFAPDGIRDVDAVLTTNELFEMVSDSRLDIDSVEPELFDLPYREVSGAGILFGASGGVAEAALRMGVEKLTGTPIDGMLDFMEVRGLEGVKTAELEIAGRELRVAVVSGLKNAEPIIRQVIDGAELPYDLVEVMACPGGCIAGAGHPVPDDMQEFARRQQVLVKIDKKMPLRKSHENPDLLALYSEFYGSPNSELAHRLLHTNYTDRQAPNRVDAKQRAQSAYRTREIRVCMDKHCFAKGSYQLLTTIQERIHKLKMDHMVRVVPYLGSGHSQTEDIFISLDGARIPQSDLQDLDAFLTQLV